ncbi:HD-GYP domain-containing protein [Shewanella nanhaiensis]|uniref:HD-GYP domain-containing protein n=1 Tax=Shewanella nanhaiensis TaxID=2864872 RepID=A0ABS7E955_9GAMM|nr:HD-GYP domain-containing protein [Shewanella nanhaiensis]MBW8186155.1 HD-GYP domain-containing protein [Shewanella nanhaiensis]
MTDIALLEKITYALDTALHVRDEYTHSHSNRVIGIAMELGEKFNLSSVELSILKVCARFHDIGKIGIPDNILLKPGKLTDNEFEVIKTHTQIGAAIISKINLPNIDVFADIILYHHEWFDGSGYPTGLVAHDIPLCSRILAVVDSYDAMTSRRSYRDILPVEQAIKIIKSETGQHFDPEVAEVFLKSIT